MGAYLSKALEQLAPHHRSRVPRRGRRSACTRQGFSRRSCPPSHGSPPLQALTPAAPLHPRRAQSPSSAFQDPGTHPSPLRKSRALHRRRALSCFAASCGLSALHATQGDLSYPCATRLATPIRTQSGGHFQRRQSCRGVNLKSQF